MSIKISVKDASKRYRVTERTIYRKVAKYEVYQFENGLYDRDQLDALFDNYFKPDYLEIDWSRAGCKGLPTDFFYRIEERGVLKLIDVDVFRFTCAPCPIWKQCLRYATDNEEYGVWGGMTTDERNSVSTGENPDIKRKVINDFSKYGITKEMIYEAIGQ